MFKYFYYCLKNLSKTTPPAPSFLEVISEFSNKEIKENNLSPSTQKKYGHIRTNIEAFLIMQGKKDIPLLAVKLKLMEDLRSWLIATLESCSVSHCSRHLEFCKRAMSHAATMEYISFNPLNELETKRDRTKKIVSLTAEEIKKLIYHNLKNELYKTACELYVFQATTGLSYCDLWTYKLVWDKDGKEWIEGKRGKYTNFDRPYYVPLFHPLFEPAKKIHEKYAGRLPYLSNATYNRILKEISGLLEIEKHLTTHTARKTFATLMDEAGVSAGTIAYMMGNTEPVVREHYILRGKNRVEQEFSLRIVKQ